MVLPAILTRTQLLHFTEGETEAQRAFLNSVCSLFETQCGLFKHLILSHSLQGEVKPLLQRREAKYVEVKKYLGFPNFAVFLAYIIEQALYYCWDITRPGYLKVSQP